MKQRIPMSACALWLLALGSPGHAASALETIRVEAERPGVDLARSEAARVPGGVTVVDVDDLQHRSVTSMADVLRFVPGVWAASSTGNDGVFFSSRGSNLDATDFDQNGVKLLQDGLPVTTADGNNHNRIVDPLAAQYAVVARGANAMAYGASTLGGAVNFVSPTARERPGVELRLEGGQHGQRVARLSLGRAFNERADGRITIEGKSWQGYRGHNDQTRTGAYGNLGWNLGDELSTRFFATWIENDQELAGALTRAQIDADRNQASPNALGGDFQLNVDTWRVANVTTWRMSPDTLLEFGASLEKQDLFHPIVDKVLIDIPGVPVPVEVFSLLVDTEHRDVGAMARLHRRAGAHQLTLGLNVGRNDVDGGNYRNDGGRRNGLTSRVDNDAGTWEVFLMDRWQAGDRWMIEFAGQGVFADRSVRTTRVADGTVTSPDGSYTAFNPRVGVIFEPARELAVYANVSRLYEPPTNFELEDDVRGGAEPLDAMYGTVIELGVRGNREFGALGRWQFDVAAYYAAIRDEILSVDDPAAPGTSLTTNIDRTVHAGVEALLGAALTVGSDYRLEPRLTFTLNRFRFDDDPVFGDNDLPAAPQYVLRGELLLRHARGFYAGPTFDLVGERYADFANQFHVDDYALLGLRGGFEGRAWQAFLEVRNLLDTNYIATHAVRNAAAADADILFPGAPRTISAGLTLTF